MKNYSSKTSLLFYLLNLLGISVIFIVLYIIKFNGIKYLNTNYLLLYLLSFTVFFLLSVTLKEPNIIRYSYKNIFYKFISGYIPFCAFVFALSFLLKSGAYSRKFVLLFLAIYLLYLLLLYYVFSLFERINILKTNTINILIIGAGSLGRKLYNEIQREFGNSVNIIGFLDDHKNGSASIIGKICDYKKILDKYKVDETYITIPMVNETKIQSMIEMSELQGVRVRLIPNYFRLHDIKFSANYLGDIPVINVRDLPLENEVNRLIKRLFDILFSSFIIVIISPIMLLTAILIKLTSKGPVFFIPTRIGLNRKQFKMFKFRSMVVQPPEISEKLSTIDNDPRITPVGKFIRRWNIDELPQFINVLKGDMSVIGPRPHRVNLDEEFINEVYNYRIRQCVKPGITGWAQVNGYRGPTNTSDRKNGRVEHNLYYIENWSPLLDFKIVFLTVFGMKARKNAF